MKAPLTASTSPGSSSPRWVARYWLSASPAPSRGRSGEVGEGAEWGGEGALAGVVELARLGQELAADHADSRVGVQPHQRGVEGARVDLRVGVEQQHRFRLVLAQDEVVGGGEADVLLPDQPHLGNSRSTMSGRRVGAAAVDHGHPRGPPCRMLVERAQAAAQHRFRAVADDDDLKVERRARLQGLFLTPDAGHVRHGFSRRLRRGRSPAACAAGSPGRRRPRGCRGSRAPSPAAPRR